MHPGDGADIARHRFLQFKALERLVAQDLGHPEFFAFAVAVYAQGAFALADAAREHAADGHVAEIVVIV